MYFDYTELIKSLHKDNLCFDYLEHKGSFKSGIDIFTLKGKNNIDMVLNDRTSELRLKANFPYFWQGHNFCFQKAQLTDAIQYTSEILNLNLFESEVKHFEFGTLLETDFCAEEILFNHISYEGKPLQAYFNRNRLSGKEYKSACFRFKMYDAGRNIKNKLPEAIKSDLRRLYGYDKGKHYLKIENHYKKPQNHFKKRILSVEDILSDSFMKICKEDLINTYMNIMKTGIVKLPENKKDINAGTLPLILLKELEHLHGFNTEQLLMQKLKSIPESNLPKPDKKARKRQLESNLKKIQHANQSLYDLTSALQMKEIL